jgi:hypothetical protein
MRMKSFGLGLLTALILASGGGCKKSASEAPPGKPLVTNHESRITNPPSTALARLHWLGKKQIAAQTNSSRFMNLWNLLESARLETQTLDKLALALAGTSQAGTSNQLSVTGSQSRITNHESPATNYPALVTSHPAAALLRPLLDDIVREEWYLEIQQATNQPAELALAIRLDDPRAGLWTSNLAAVLASMTNVQALPAPASRLAWRLQRMEDGGQRTEDRRQKTEDGDTHHESRITDHAPRLDLARAGDWTVLGAASETNALLAELCHRIRVDHTPVAASGTGSALQMDPVTRKVRPAPASPAGTFWLEADLDLRRISSALALGWNLPGALPKALLTVTGDNQGVRTRAELDFAEPVPLEIEAWNIPTNFIHDPLIGFAAVRGIRPWLKSFKPWQDLALGTPPNQAFFWAQGGLPSLHFMAVPSAEASNQVNKLSEFVLRDLNPILATNGWLRSGFARQTNSPGLVWRGVPYLSPDLNYADCGSNRFLFAGLSRNRMTNRPAPAGLFQYLETSPRLVAYGWENTGPCLEGWIQMGQLIRHLLCLPRMTFTAGHAWLAALSPQLTNSITAVELSSPTRLSLVRTSSAGFTGVELHVLADWLESIEFPRGLHTFTAPPPPPPPVRSQTNGPPEKAKG